MTDPALSFGAVADSYDRGRPAYPPEAVRWLVGETPVSVLELGAGTGKLTEALVAAGHDVFATDPDEAMLDRLSAKLPDVRATVGTAEQIPAPDHSADVIVAGQAFHWFDAERALPEIARVLKPGGRIALVWNDRDDRIPWVRRLGALIGKASSETRAPAETLIDDSALFSAVDQTTFRFWQTVDRETIQDLVLSRSHLAAASPEAREAKRAEVLAFYDDYGRGMDGMQLPYVTHCYRAVVLRHAIKPVTTMLSSEEAPAAGDGDRADMEHTQPIARVTATQVGLHDTADKLPRVAFEPQPEPRDDDTGMILIDLR